MVNRMPISASEYTLPIAFFAYESIYKKMLGPFDFSWSIGFYDLMPEIEFSAILPLKPFDLRVSAGAYYDFIIRVGLYRILQYAYNPDIPSWAVMPSAVRLCKWTEVMGDSGALSELR